MEPRVVSQPLVGEITPSSPPVIEERIETTHTVRPGDTLWSISQRFGVSWKAIAAANGLSDPLELQPGMVLRIPRAQSQISDFGVPQPPARQKLLTRPAPEPNFIWPVRGIILSRFGEGRPGLPGIVNRGIDIRVEPGTEIRAAKSGQAFCAMHVPGFGKSVTIDHGDGTVTFYGYNERILVEDGAYVRQGEPIALAGSSGRAPFPMVHFRIARGGVPVDPLPLLPR